MNEHGFEVYKSVYKQFQSILQAQSHETLPDPSVLQLATDNIHQHLLDEGYGLQKTCEHLLRDIVPGFNGSSLSPTYYGFVTGGVTPVARFADNLVTLFDQNVQVHLPKETNATVVEDRALCLLMELLELNPHDWPTRTFTTGATASNILGLGCGREFVIAQRLPRTEDLETKPFQGIIASCRKAGIENFQILSTLPHSSLGKAANIVGIGSANIIDVSKEDHFLEPNFARLEQHLATPGTASIVVISCGEVNTGAFATHSVEEVQKIRDLCDQYRAWLHVDGAFGIFTRTLPAISEYDFLRSGCAGLELADSIGGDGHKLLNVPYDCGFFLTRHPSISHTVFQNTNAAYLRSSAMDGIQSPLNIRLENSARFRGLPVYANLIAYGRVGYAATIGRMVDLSRKIAKFIDDECPHLELLPRGFHDEGMESIYICVLFRSKDDALNEILAERIKATRRIFASGTKWDGETATRFAIAKWDVNVERDLQTVKEVLSNII